MKKPCYFDYTDNNVSECKGCSCDVIIGTNLLKENVPWNKCPFGKHHTEHKADKARTALAREISNAIWDLFGTGSNDVKIKLPMFYKLSSFKSVLTKIIKKCLENEQ